MFENIDFDLLKKDIELVRFELIRDECSLDFYHMKVIYIISKIFLILGIFLLWIPYYYIFPWFFLSTGIFSNWTMIGHHVCHGGYDNFSNKNFQKKLFGQKSFINRFLDWFDWWIVEAWNIEHNHHHHYKLGEDKDPDLVEKNIVFLREMKAPFFIKKIIVFLMAIVWKWYYYAPNTYKYYCLNKLNNDELDEIPLKIRNTSFTILSYIFYSRKWMSGFFLTIAPYFIFFFVLIPTIYYYLGFFNNCILNLILAEIFTNLHSFLVIVPNHCGNDLYRFSNSVRPMSGEFYLRQIISSANFTTGNDINDFLHGWLNYQIEHHLYPNLSMLAYRKAHPKIKKLCQKHKIPYVQDNVFRRLQKTVDIMIGKTSMLHFNSNNIDINQ